MLAADHNLKVGKVRVSLGYLVKAEMNQDEVARSVYDLFGTLACGATLVVPDAAQEREPAYWHQLLNEQGVTVWNSVPALMAMLLDYDPNATLAELRLVLLSGDWIPVDLPARLRQAQADCQLISLGGATEASIWSVYYPVHQVKADWTSIPYGQPLANQWWVVLKDNAEDCPEWVAGELYIGGLGLAVGYWKDEDKTNSSFIQHPRYGRLYRTGDLGRYLPDGNLEFLGRRDFQVKIQGYRIELGEIEWALQQLHGVRQASLGRMVWGLSSRYRGTPSCHSLLCRRACASRQHPLL
jgi:non-ribosomal peptide synthetase component F